MRLAGSTNSTFPKKTMCGVADYCKTPTLHRRQIYEFKASSRNHGYASTIPDIRLLVVFPHMIWSFHNKEVSDEDSEKDSENGIVEVSKMAQKIWTDDILLPSIYRHMRTVDLKYLPASYELLQLV